MAKQPYAPCMESCRSEDHEWFVMCTESSPDGCRLLVSCEACGALGVVKNPTAEEWDRTTGEPYSWGDPSRVEVIEGNIADCIPGDPGDEEAGRA